MTRDIGVKNRPLRDRRRLLPLILLTTCILVLSCRSPAGQGLPGPTPDTFADSSTGASGAAASTVARSMTSTAPPPTRVPAKQESAPDEEPTIAPTPASDRANGPSVGAIAPSLTLPDLDGNEVSLSGLQGNVVLLNFWTTW